ncbi:isochorismatase hydrolase [Neoasaia chiangmaiensis NBRC 101099]|uniref:Isochorismatase n=1 Tax=Neoasaia chiangmaiensis TaxID=320497 RepID=A0A1U9KMI4_9PROT|nr:cysteine hydrolase [Neoasaia chiangmaiensis]AQS87011.1 isochorismatase [Neoasaia chiangmaiensis]GBR37819.1 isochorismatase hydrolase [Neoasaia chiangmaiensis NBRC 101099]GEN15139.1 peroxyureidoacrylate/ureidoacrylate amidohydrolase RutB [Neoasaia chiangmaiensis]
MTQAVSAAETALVLIEYQNDFISSGGAMHDAVRDEIARTDMLSHTSSAIALARSAGVQIVWAPIEFEPGYPELGNAPYGVLANVKAANAFIKGGWGAAIADQFAPDSADLIVSGKRGLCAFASTNLDFLLRHNGIRRIALGGFLTDCCVESTMRTAYEHGYDVVTLTDCVATLSEAQHDAAINYTYPMFSRPMTHGAFFTELAK